MCFSKFQTNLWLAYVDYMDLAVRCSRKAVKLNHSLTHLWLAFNVQLYICHKVKLSWSICIPCFLSNQYDTCFRFNLILLIIFYDWSMLWLCSTSSCIWSMWSSFQVQYIFLSLIDLWYDETWRLISIICLSYANLCWLNIIYIFSTYLFHLYIYSSASSMIYNHNRLGANRCMCVCLWILISYSEWLLKVWCK